MDYKDLLAHYNSFPDMLKSNIRNFSILHEIETTLNEYPSGNKRYTADMKNMLMEVVEYVWLKSSESTFNPSHLAYRLISAIAENKITPEQVARAGRDDLESIGFELIDPTDLPLCHDFNSDYYTNPRLEQNKRQKKNNTRRKETPDKCK